MTNFEIIVLSKRAGLMNNTKGGVFIKYYIHILIVTLFLVGCSDNRDSVIFEKLEVSEEGDAPVSTLLNREEMTNQSLRYTNTRIEEAGEEAARKSVADRFSMLNDHLSSGIVDIIDSAGDKYRAIYIGNDNTVNYILNKSQRNEYEEEVLELYEEMNKTNKKMPYIKFSAVE
jgi:PBP1b-binding outer membrane lipoprotein LpoB